MKKNFLIPKNISTHILMIGVYWKNNAPGGISSVVNEYAKNFDTLKYIVTTASRDESKIKKLFYVIKGLLLYIFYLTFNRQIKIIHIQGSSGVSYDRKKIFIKIGKLFKKKIIWHMHASQFVPFYEKRKDKNDIVRTLNMANSLVVLSQYYKDFYEGIGVNKEKIYILNNIIPLPNLHKEKHTDKKIHFLFLGEISNRKGIFDLLDCISQYKENLKDKIQIRIGGNGEIERLTKCITTLGLSQTVSFEGWVNSSQKINLLNWTDVYILPSYNEGLPISILEALSYQCPVISTPVGGIEEIVHNGQNGLIIRPGNIEDIYQAILFYINNPQMITEHGKISQIIAQNYYPEPVLNSLLSLYNKYL